MLPRKIFPSLKAQCKDKKISLLLGPRQVGKTTLLKALQSELSKNFRCLFLDMDILSNYEKVSTFENLLNTLKLEGYEESQKEFFYLFLDEFQKHADLATIMKNVYDSHDNIKIYASGSSSLIIKNQVQESLAGRKYSTEVLPLDFEEFLWFKGNEKLSAQFSRLHTLQGNHLNKIHAEFENLWEEFLIYGSYPELVLKITPQEKISILESIFDLYVKKDLVDFLKIAQVLNVKRLIEFIAVNHGQKIKYEEASKATNLSFVEIKTFLEILEETYLIQVVRPFYTNKEKELVKIPKIYFIDAGVRNYFINNFNVLSLRNDASFLCEGAVIAEIRKKVIKKIHFWQDKNKNEVDIVITSPNAPLPIEIKYKKSIKSEDFKGLEAFIAAYPKVKKAFLLNLAQQKKGKKINMMLPYAIQSIA